MRQLKPCVLRRNIPRLYNNQTNIIIFIKLDFKQVIALLLLEIWNILMAIVKITLREIASKAGVAKSTASYALNNSYIKGINITEETRIKIKKIATTTPIIE